MQKNLSQCLKQIMILFTSSCPMLSLPGVRLDWPTLGGIVVACCKNIKVNFATTKNSQQAARLHFSSVTHLLHHIFIDQPLPLLRHAHLDARSNQNQPRKKRSHPNIFLLMVPAQLQQGKHQEAAPAQHKITEGHMTYWMG